MQLCPDNIGSLAREEREKLLCEVMPHVAGTSLPMSFEAALVSATAKTITLSNEEDVKAWCRTVVPLVATSSGATLCVSEPTSPVLTKKQRKTRSQARAFRRRSCLPTWRQMSEIVFGECPLVVGQDSGPQFW